MGRKMLEPSERIVTVTVVQAGLPDVILQCPGKKFFYQNLH
jgi:hypothetical protein